MLSKMVSLQNSQSRRKEGRNQTELTKQTHISAIDTAKTAAPIL